MIRQGLTPGASIDPKGHSSNELSRYLNAGKRRLIAVVENLWDKYAVSSRELEAERAQTLKKVEGFLQSLGYLGGKD